MEQKKGGFINNRILDIFEEVSCGKWYIKRYLRMAYLEDRAAKPQKVKRDYADNKNMGKNKRKERDEKGQFAKKEPNLCN